VQWNAHNTTQQKTQYLQYCIVTNYNKCAKKLVTLSFCNITPFTTINYTTQAHYFMCQLHWTTNFKKIFVSVMDMLLIYLFASTKLEMGH